MASGLASHLSLGIDISGVCLLESGSSGGCGWIAGYVDDAVVGKHTEKKNSNFSSHFLFVAVVRSRMETFPLVVQKR